MPDSTRPEPFNSSPPENHEPTEQTVRLNKAIADTGYCARRKADALIQAGQVQVNGQTVTELGTRIHPTKDTISIDGKPLSHAEKAYLLFHKPTGYVTSRRGGRNQKTIYELIPPQYQSVDPAGRLDQESSGALLLSNDGDFLYQITHPKFHLPKIYEITLDRTLTQSEVTRLLAGVPLLPENKLARMSRIVQDTKHAQRYEVELITGYSRQIRRTAAAVGAKVITLSRLAFGPIALGNLKPGHCRALTPEEQSHLLGNWIETPRQ